MCFSKYFLRRSLPNGVFEVFGNKSKTIDDFLNQNNIEKFCIDSRKAQANYAFIALEGNNVDGHSFLQEALERGAIAFIIKRDKKDCLQKVSKKLLDGKLVILVDDTLKALTELAKHWRLNFDYPVIGITGSIGKTSTKQMIASILQFAKFPAYISFKNQNTIIGLSLNILNMRDEHKAAIFELGISQIGEMDQLADILRPTIALITRISHSHTLNLGTLAGVAEQKRQIFKYFNTNNIGVICGDQQLLTGSYYNHPVIKFGLQTKNQIQARMIKEIDGGTSFMLKIYGKKQRIKLNGNHSGFVNNALAASSLAHLLNIMLSDIAQGLQSFKGFDNRFEQKKITKGRGFFVSDCYNANPESMKAAIFAFGQMKSNGPKIVVLGDMLELGENEYFWHKHIGRFLSKISDLSVAVLVGKRAKLIAKTAPVTLKIDCVDNWQQAKDRLNSILQNNKQKESLILVKASRGVQLDKMVDELSC